MNAILRHGLLAGLAITAVSGFAADEQTLDRVEVTSNSASIAAAQAVLSQADFQSMYAMSTGRVMTVQAEAEALLVQYSRRSPTRLRHDGQGRFVSSDGRLALSFQLDQTGEPQQVRLNMPAAWQ